MSPPAPRLIEQDYVAVKRCRHGLFALCWWHIVDCYNPQNYFGNSVRLWGVYREANVLCFPKEAQVNAVGLLPVDGLDDTYVKAMHRGQ